MNNNIIPVFNGNGYIHADAREILDELRERGYTIFSPNSNIQMLINAVVEFEKVPRSKSNNELTEELHAAARVFAEEMKK